MGEGNNKITVKLTRIPATNKEGEVVKETVAGKVSTLYIQDDLSAIVEMIAMADNGFIAASEYADFGPLRKKALEAYFQEKEAIVLNVGEAGLLKKILNRMPGPQDTCKYQCTHLSTISILLPLLK